MFLSAAAPQSTGHVFMIRPSAFYSNPQTRISNPYQTDDDTHSGDILARACAEIDAFSQALMAKGVAVTIMQGSPDCPDHVFPNWASTHGRDGVVFYPMNAPNRRLELTSEIRGFLERHYKVLHDFVSYQNKNQFLESTGSLVMDRVNKIAYAALSDRTTDAMAKLWAEKMGYRIFTFETKSSFGIPVYHTDLLMYIGTHVAAVCLEAIVDDNKRQAVLESLKSTHRHVVELSLDQLDKMSGNALEVRGFDGNPYLAISASGWGALRAEQQKTLQENLAGIISTPLPTLEFYGGGSARCTLMELF